MSGMSVWMWRRGWQRASYKRRESRLRFWKKCYSKTIWGQDFRSLNLHLNKLRGKLTMKGRTRKNSAQCWRVSDRRRKRSNPTATISISKIFNWKLRKITHSGLSFQNKARQELQKSSLREIDELKHKITKKKKQEVTNLQSENDGLNSYIRGKKAKMVSTSYEKLYNKSQLRNALQNLPKSDYYLICLI